MAENRYKFSRMLDKIGVDQPLWKELTSFDEAHEACARFGYPVLVRPSYVLSGAAMNVVYSPEDLSSYLSQATAVNREHPVVITKYLEGAKEIEMDAVARDGKMMMHYISEHVENAGVHSGDATLILPPQDLDPETVRRIEVATSKIAASLHVTGPFNIQFIAKNNEIKVIECNVRAARSFPFVSKVTGVDAIELATKVMLGLEVEPYPKVTLPKDYVGVKVPQFSFSRLAGADPILGVEMASTGEVACFGRNKYEAYLKAMIASGIKLPKQNVLLSIGSYSEKQELLPSVKTLHQLGFTLYGSSGSADFYSEQGIPVIHLEALPEDDDWKGGEDNAKTAYSLLSHLTQGLSSLFISLPSKNKYRRPASFTSMGYRARRLAIDRSIPLITNVKNAKLFVEALARHRKLGSHFDISPVDFKTSHRSHTFPGLFNMMAFVPSLADPTSGAREVAEMTQASLAGGFTGVQILPVGLTTAINDEGSLSIAEGKITGAAHCDVSLSIAASVSNSAQVAELSTRTRALMLSSQSMGTDTSTSAALSSHFATWPEARPIVTDAKGTDLASALLFASLHSRSVHVTNVMNREDIQLIVLSKAKGLEVTCDVCVYALFFTTEMFPRVTCLPTMEDQNALWDNMDSIDIFSTGSTPYKVALELGESASAMSGVEETMKLLLNAVNDGRLTLEDIEKRLYHNPKDIFGLPDQTNTSVEVEIDRPSAIVKKSFWSPLDSTNTVGSIHRVIVKGRTVVVDNERLSNGTLGQNVSSAIASTSLARSSSAKGAHGGVPVNSIGAALPPSTAANRRVSFSTDVTSRFGGLAVATNGSALDDVSSPPSLALNTKSPVLASSELGVTSTPRSNNLMAAFRGESDQAISSMSLSRAVAPALPSRSLFSRHPTFNRKHILSVRQFNREDLHALFTVASEMRYLVERQGTVDVLKGKVLCNLFYEESTRTSCSFETAMVRCGGQVVSVNAKSSSVVKGESLADTVRTLGCYGDAIVLRHPAVGSSQEASKFSPVPILNAGDGVGEHPSQALLDVFTIREELGTVSGLTVGLIGDLKHGRTTHSLARLLALYGVTLVYISPASLSMPRAVYDELKKKGVTQHETTNLEEVLPLLNVAYCTRIQQERFDSSEAYEAVKGAYRIDMNLLSRKGRDDLCIMHPLPRNEELADDVGE